MAKLSIVVDFISDKFSAGIANVKRGLSGLGDHVSKSFGKGLFGKLLGFTAVTSFFRQIASEATKAFESGDFSVYGEKTATALAKASKNVEGFWNGFKSKAGAAMAWAASRWMSLWGTIGALTAGSSWSEARAIGKAEGSGAGMSEARKAARDATNRQAAIDRAVAAAQKRQADEREASEKKYSERLKAQVKMWKDIARNRNESEREWHRISAAGYEQMMSDADEYDQKVKDAADSWKNVVRNALDAQVAEKQENISKLRQRADRLANIAMPQEMSPLQEMAEKAGKKLLRGKNLSTKELAAIEAVSAARQAAEQDSKLLSRIADNTDFLKQNMSLGH